MPQLDKYLYLHNVVTLTLCFLAIYVFTRKSLVPHTSSVLKYRSKRNRSLVLTIEEYKRIKFSYLIVFASAVKRFGLHISEKLRSFVNFNSDLAFANLYRTYWTVKPLGVSVSKNLNEVKVAQEGQRLITLQS